MDLYKSVIENNIDKDLHHRYEILVVEDDDVSYMLLNEILASYPVKLTRANNGLTAIENFENNTSLYDLVLMDIRLPKLNGYAATRRIKELNPSIPVIAVTAYAHSQGIIDCYESGCDDFISKPFDINKIVKLIEHHLISRN